MRTVAILLVTLLLGSVIGPAAAAGPASVGTTHAVTDAAGGGAVDGDALREQQEAPPDPEEDVIGWENGYWHNESIDVDQSDGLSDAELEAFVARSMARVEFVRQAEFDETVPVSVISREEFQDRSSSSAEQVTRQNRWNDQVWEGLFIVGEDQLAREALSSVFGGSVAGFYSPTNDEIVIVSDDTENPTVDNATLVHELVHALQDQRFDLTAAQYRGQTQDENIAIDGIVEGEANYVETRYAQRCGAEWECVSTPSSSSGGGGDLNLGIFLTVFTPYSDGPVYVDQLLDEGGWDAVDEAFRNPPQSSEQIIQGTDDEPERLPFRDRARNGWSLFPNQGVDGAETVGEGSIYSMFWYQSRNYGADTIDWRNIGNTRGPYDAYNYDARPSAGWANDKLVPYQKGSGSDAQYGYVWKTKWDTVRDATQFREAYLEVLEAHDVQQRDDGVYVVPSGPWADAFVVQQVNRTVTIVNGPTPEAVTDIRPDAASTVETPETATSTPAADDEPTETPDESTDTTEMESTSTVDTPTQSGSTTTAVFGPGFTVGLAVAAVALLAGLSFRRRD